MSVGAADMQAQLYFDLAKIFPDDYEDIQPKLADALPLCRGPRGLTKEGNNSSGFLLFFFL